MPFVNSKLSSWVVMTEVLDDTQSQTYDALVNMGFDSGSAIQAAQLYGSNVEQATNYLLDVPGTFQINHYNNGALMNSLQNDEQISSKDKNVNSKKVKKTNMHTFGMNHISQMIVIGMFHESMNDDEIENIFPDVIQIVILQYTNLLFIKAHSHTNNDQNDNESKDIQYLAFNDESEQDITFRSIALSLETENDNLESNDSKNILSSNEKYPQFVRLWIRMNVLNLIFSFEENSYSMIKSNEIESDKRWVEIPSDLQLTSIFHVQHVIKNKEKLIEIGVEKLYDEIKTQSNSKTKNKFDAGELKVGDIIDCYDEGESEWFESVVINITSFNTNNDEDKQIKIEAHHIGLDADATFMGDMFETKIDFRGKHSNGPRRDNEWRYSWNNQTGFKLDIYDIAYSKWYTGEIVEIDDDNKRVKVHYDGYSTNYDEYIAIKSLRLATLNTHTVPDAFWSTF